ncbi:MAG: hypothetical protein CMN30_29265 [Sandaracinus sp.]|nr:hypothetical protein [Sandaracinus sp.]|tara:strand:- start:222 stop:473 length:252 start_codon:yes stop_codon:yes gene_type:complete
MTRWTALFVLALACGPDPDPAPSPDPRPEPAAEVEPDPLLEEDGEELEPAAPLDEAALDAMEEPELEAACFQGSTAACDRLGH